MEECTLEAIATLERRLQRCERSQRRWRRGATALGLALTLLVGLGASATQDEEPPFVEHLRVGVLEVVDEDQVVLVRLGPDSLGHGEVAVGDLNGRISSYLGSTDDGWGAVGVLGRTGALVGLLSASRSGDGGAWVSTADGGQVHYVGADLRGNGWVAPDAKPGRRL